MRRAARVAVALGLIAVGGCSSPSELMVAVHTDLSVPDDIDAVQLEVRRGGDVKFLRKYERLGSEQAGARLPFTLGVVTEEPGVEVTLHAIAWATNEPRILRKVVTTVPEERVALVHLPLHFLCGGSARMGGGPLGAIDVEDECGAGETCVAGACVAAKVDSALLPDYAPEDVFGGSSGQEGTGCFDVARCFAGATEIANLGGDCSFEAKDPVNVALETAPGGSLRGHCDDHARCLVALDAGGEAGFRQHDGVVALPPEVCTQKAEGKVLKVWWMPAASTPVGEACAQKVLAQPTCGPASAVGGG
ncbi:hypothetical protein [Sorangium sp. So ce131]|uniref:hypothetical protein n=1 Tax=Sorangium sp. So ce131 TaxID=3133282 RepID=UPI003F62DBF1